MTVLLSTRLSRLSGHMAWHVLRLDVALFSRVSKSWPFSSTCAGVGMVHNKFSLVFDFFHSQPGARSMWVKLSAESSLGFVLDWWERSSQLHLPLYDTIKDEQESPSAEVLRIYRLLLDTLRHILSCCVRIALSAGFFEIGVVNSSATVRYANSAMDQALRS